MSHSTAQHDYWFVTHELTLSAFKLRDQGTLLGFLWTLLQPLSMLAVLYWIFHQEVGAAIEHFALYMLTGIVLWTFFASGTSKGLTSLVARRDLINSVTFPHELIVLSAVLTVVFSSTLEFGFVLLFALVSGLGMSWVWLGLPVVLMMEVLLVIGLALLLAPWYVYVRDLDNIWGILLRIGFFLTPVFYLPEQFLSPGQSRLYMLNPVTQIMMYAREILLQHRLPTVAALVGTLVVVTGILLIGLVNFRYFAGDLAERI